MCHLYSSESPGTPRQGFYLRRSTKTNSHGTQETRGWHRHTVLLHPERADRCTSGAVEVDIAPDSHLHNRLSARAVLRRARSRAGGVPTPFQFSVGPHHCHRPRPIFQGSRPVSISPLAIVILAHPSTDRRAIRAARMLNSTASLSLSGELRVDEGGAPSGPRRFRRPAPGPRPHINAAEPGTGQDCEVMSDGGATHLVIFRSFRWRGPSLGFYRAEPPAVARTVLPDLCDVRADAARRGLGIAAAVAQSVV